MMNTETNGLTVKRRPNFFVRLIRGLIITVLILAAVLLLLESTVFWEAYAKLFFGVDTLHSEYDADGDGIDDYTDIMLSARAYIRTDPQYDENWWNGYPPDELGVCTDVVWKALEGAGYGRGDGENEFKSRIDRDIRTNPRAYPKESDGGPLINFRRVTNLMVFFERHCQKLTLDVTQIEKWQPGDIVFYSPSHVAIVSDRRGLDGQPWIIHLTSDGAMEEDNLDYSRLEAGKVVITGHYRWAQK